ncbi:MAG: glycosyltransferase family 2 protein [Armatimonadetes bacterium]|nr:glycosyltransferase family 2 protein [Armatimonadota bacterium]
MQEQPRPQLSIVIPAFNEAAVIGDTVGTVCQFVADQGLCAEVIVVDDGSTDETAILAEQALARWELPSKVIRLNPNEGKAVAVRRGMLEARGDLLLMTDADLSVSMGHLPKLMDAIRAGADIAIASRAVRGARLDPPQPFWRLLIGKMYGLLRRLIVLPRIADTQCGFKLFTRQAAREAFSRQASKSWAFDAEVLYIAHRLGYSIVEVPVVWCNRRESKVRVLRDLWSVLRDLLAVRWRHRKLNRRDRACGG